MKLCNPYIHPSAISNRNQPFAALFRNPFANVPSLAHFIDKEVAAPSPDLPTDVFEDAEHYFVRLEVPGVKKEDLNIELKDRELSITASAKTTGPDGEESFTSSRSLSVPVGVSADNVTAKLENGILTLTLAKPAEQKPRTISVA